MTFLDDIPFFSTFAALACALGDTASAADLLYPSQLCVCRFFATFLSFLVPRTTHEQPAPQRNASATQHNSTTNSRLQQQQQRQHATPINYSKNCSVKLRPTTHFLLHRCSRLRGKKQSQAAATTAETQNTVTWHSMETPSQRQVTQGPVFPRSGPHPHKARASHNNRGGPSTTAILCASCVELCCFPQFLFECIVCEIFSECIAATRNMSQSDRARTFSALSACALIEHVFRANTASMRLRACSIVSWSLHVLVL